MRAIAKPILLLAAILLAIPLGIIISLNIYLQSKETRERLISALSSQLGVPVTIRGTFGLPLGGIRIHGISGRLGTNPPVISADSATIHPDYRELLRGRFTITEIALAHPVVRLVRQPQKPDSGAAPTATSTLRENLPGENRPTGSAPPSSMRNALRTKGTKEAPEFVAGLRKLSITGGGFTLLDERGLPVISLEGISLEGNSEGDGGWKGLFETHQAIIGTGLILRDIRSRVSLPGDLSRLTLTDLSSSFGAGKLTGRVTLDLPPSSPGYTAELILSGARLSQLLADSSLGSPSAEGIVNGELALSGIAGKESTRKGKGALRCTGAVIQPVDFLRQIGHLMQIDELQLLRLAEGNALFHLDAGRIVIDELFLKSENLILAAKGPVNSSGEIDLQARLLFNEKLTARLRSLLGSQLTPAPETGYSQVAFKVSGTSLKPRTDLLERLTGIRVGGDLGGLLQGLFGRPASPSPATPAGTPPSPNL
jgi:hypothetical protein